MASDTTSRSSVAIWSYCACVVGIFLILGLPLISCSGHRFPYPWKPAGDLEILSRSRSNPERLEIVDDRDLRAGPSTSARNGWHHRKFMRFGGSVPPETAPGLFQEKSILTVRIQRRSSGVYPGSQPNRMRIYIDSAHDSQLQQGEPVEVQKVSTGSTEDSWREPRELDPRNSDIDRSDSWQSLHLHSHQDVFLIEPVVQERSLLEASPSSKTRATHREQRNGAPISELTSSLEIQIMRAVVKAPKIQHEIYRPFIESEEAGNFPFVSTRPSPDQRHLPRSPSNPQPMQQRESQNEDEHGEEQEQEEEVAGLDPIHGRLQPLPGLSDHADLQTPKVADDSKETTEIVLPIAAAEINPSTLPPNVHEANHLHLQNLRAYNRDVDYQPVFQKLPRDTDVPRRGPSPIHN